MCSFWVHNSGGLKNEEGFNVKEKNTTWTISFNGSIKLIKILPASPIKKIIMKLIKINYLFAKFSNGCLTLLKYYSFICTRSLSAFEERVRAADIIYSPRFESERKTRT